MEMPNLHRYPLAGLGKLDNRMGRDMDLTGFVSLMEVRGGALLEALEEVAQRKLDVNSALAVAARAALDSREERNLQTVQEALAGLSDEVRDGLLREVHRKMCFDGTGLVRSWPPPGSTGGSPPTKHWSTSGMRPR